MVPWLTRCNRSNTLTADELRLSEIEGEAQAPGQ
jgi:hypothetical protein